MVDWHRHCSHCRIQPVEEYSMTRDELTRKVLSTKRAKRLTWKTVVAEIGGGSAVYLIAALMGQMKLRPE
jgi:cyanate lyase